jgi:hypothetical protein
VSNNDGASKRAFDLNRRAFCATDLTLTGLEERSSTVSTNKCTGFAPLRTAPFAQILTNAMHR